MAADRPDRRTSVLFRVVLTILFTATLTLGCSRCQVDEVRAQPPREGEAEKLFVRYLKIDTSNPPGNETKAARFLQQALAKEGIESKLVGPDPARMSIWARLKSGKKAPALVLLHHLDVVPADASEWTVPPFSGARADGYIWGRGALDIKSLGIADLMAMAYLAHHRESLSRDVIFLGVADEEAGGALGTEWLLDHHPELFDGVGAVLNEGGANEVIVDKVAYWGIEVDQKVPLWVRIATTGQRGHGAVPPDDGGASARLVGLLGQILNEPVHYEVVPTVERYFHQLAATKRGRKKVILSDVSAHLGDADFTKLLSAGYRSLMRDTMALTWMRAGSAVNMIPGKASADLDIRLLPGRSIDATLDRIRKICGDKASVEVLLRGEPVEPSPVDTPTWRAIQHVMLASEPGSKVGTLVTPGTTDCRFFRARGITCYGVSPFKVNYYDGDRVHGVDERIRSRFFDEGIGVMREIVRSIATNAE